MHVELARQMVAGVSGAQSDQSRASVCTTNSRYLNIEQELREARATVAELRRQQHLFAFNQLESLVCDKEGKVSARQNFIHVHCFHCR